MLAMEVERRLRLKHVENIDQNDISNIGTSDVDETLVKECSMSNNDTSAAVESLLDDNVLTMKADEKKEEEDEQFTKTEVDYANMPTPDKSKEMETDTKSKALNIPQLSLTIDLNSNAYEADNLSPSFSLHSSPSLGALDESRNQSLYFTPMSGRESFSPRPHIDGGQSSPRLIRSNSYTLEKPSPMLLKHMEINGIPIGSSSPMKSPMALNEFRKNQSTPSNIPRVSLGGYFGTTKQLKPNNLFKSNTSVAPMNRLSISGSKQSVSPNTSINATLVTSSKNSVKSNTTKPNKTQNALKNRKQPNQSSCFKNNETILRSIYTAVKPSKVHNSAKKVKTSTTSSNPNGNAYIQPPIVQSNPQTVTNANLNGQTFSEVLATIEKQHADQMRALVERQQEEQQRMHAEFLRQQEELMKMISTLVMKKSEKHSPANGMAMPNANVARKSNEKMLIEEVNNEMPITYDANGNRINRFTPPENSKCIRRLNYDENKHIGTEIDNDNSSLSSLSTFTINSEKSEAYSAEELQAVIIIQAYARGYLTRRLFGTARVKEIKKTHYDTLVLLLDICEEKSENESKSDIEFKMQLLQQVIIQACD